MAHEGVTGETGRRAVRASRTASAWGGAKGNAAARLEIGRHARDETRRRRRQVAAACRPLVAVTHEWGMVDHADLIWSLSPLSLAHFSSR